MWYISVSNTTTVTTEAVILHTLSVTSSRNFALMLLEDPSDLKRLNLALCALIWESERVYIHKQALLLPLGQEVGVVELNSDVLVKKKKKDEKFHKDKKKRLRTRRAATEHVETWRAGEKRPTDGGQCELRVPAASSRAWCVPHSSQREGGSIMDTGGGNRTLSSHQSAEKLLVWQILSIHVFRHRRANANAVTTL